MKPFRTLHAIAAALSLWPRAAAASQPSSLRNGEEKAGGTAGSGLPIERSLRLGFGEDTEVPADGDDTAKENLFNRDVEYSKDLYHDRDVQMLCPKELSCKRGFLAVRIGGVCTCLRHCSRVCRNFSIICNGSYGSGSVWESFENLRCYQWERAQLRMPVPSTFPFALPVSRRFLRTTCKCPNRNYSVSNSCMPWTQANLSNCIRGEISNGGAYEINFGDLTNVQIGRVHSYGQYWDDGELKGYDIDFQGDVAGSHFCELESAQGDIEFGGETCPINFEGNSVMSVDAGDDLQFEEGAWVTGNSFGTVNAAKDWQFNGADQPIRSTVISQNYFGTTNVGEECKYKDQDVADTDVDDNSCNSFTVGDDDDCDDVFAGFDCV